MSTIAQPHHPARGWLSALSLATLTLLTACDRNATRPGATVAQVPAQASNEANPRATKSSDAVADKAKDAAITTKINTLLGRDSELNALKIDVEAKAGQVVLEGTAPNDAARARAADLARSVDGVRGVVNKLQVTAGK